MNSLIKHTLAICSLTVLAACSTSLPDSRQNSERHLEPPPARTTDVSGIPAPVASSPTLPQPQPQAAPELFSVVVQDVSVRELLFALARDAGVNIDVHPDVTGFVSVNAIDQTLPQIIERINRQIDFRWQIEADGTLHVEPDSPFLRTYRVDYVNVSRDASTGLSVSTSLTTVAGATGGTSSASNSSNASLQQVSSNNFWGTLVSNIRALIGESDAGGGDGGGAAVSSVISNPESGLITVNATSRQHRDIAAYIDQVRQRSLTQVLIEATVVEVSLNDSYQSGVDWATVSRNSGQIDFLQSLTGLNMADSPASVLTIDRTSTPDAVAATIRLLSEFGDLRVLSSPRIMALNNQAALLRVVDNRVYFTIEVQPGQPATATTPGTAPIYTSEIHTVPIGFVMSVTPQIGDNEQVTLNVRPTISRIVRFVNDPSPALAEAGVTNLVPELQIREIESILKVYSGQIAVLGGLMQDTVDNNTTGLPVASRLPGIRNLFSYRSDTARKTELIVFIRPVIVRQPSLDGDLSNYSNLLPESGLQINDQFSGQPGTSGQRSNR